MAFASPSVSICLPVYNGAKYLSEALTSALAQTYNDFELLIADDRSTDESAAIIASFAKGDKRIKAWTNESNLGHYGNYNACISKASGKYIKLFAQDDVLHPEMLRRYTSIFETNPSIGLVNCARRWIDADGNRLNLNLESDLMLTKPFEVDTHLTGEAAIVWALKDVLNPLGEPSSQMFRADLVDGGFDESFRQIGDLEYNIRILDHSDFYFIAEELCQFRKHSLSWTTTNSFVLSTYLEWLLVASKHRQYLAKAGLTPESYCLNFVSAWVRNLEERFYKENRFDPREIEKALHELCGKADPLSLFSCQKNGERDLLSEYRGFSGIALLQAVMLANELRLANEEAARPYTDVAAASSLKNSRPGFVAALEGLKETLRERDREILALRQSLSAMGGSLSWKITEPIRHLKLSFHNRGKRDL